MSSIDDQSSIEDEGTLDTKKKSFYDDLYVHIKSCYI